MPAKDVRSARSSPRSTQRSPGRDAIGRGRRGIARPQMRPRRSWRNRLFRWFIGLFLVGVVVFGIGVAVAFSYIESVPVPPEKVQVQTAYVYAAGGEKLATLSNGENRESVPLDRVPRVVRNAVLAAEDRRFYEHGGVDPVGVLRALYQDIRSKGRRPQGGSTITQQYVKNVFVGREASLRRKVREAAIAVKLERKLTKDQILERYLNTIYFGRGSYGIQAASKAFFGKDVRDLGLVEASYLAALIRGPESTDIAKNPERAEQRRTFVLTAMVETGMITSSQKADALAVPLSTLVVPRRSTIGTRYEHANAGVQFAVDYAKRVVIDQFGENAFETQGLRITTTIDLSLQTKAQRAAFETVLNKPSDPDAAVIVQDHSGHILAMVGGRNYAESNVNLAVGKGGGGVGRAGGSTFKPFALAAAVRQGFSVESAFNAPKSIEIAEDGGRGEPWKVSNYDDKSYGTMNLIDATRLSVNTVFAQLVSHPDVGAAAVADTATLLGITSPLQAVDSIVLGTQNVSPLEMADAYRTFANRGIASGSVIVSKVTDANGKSLTLKAVPSRRVLDEGDADIMNTVLTNVVTNGTGTAAAVPGLAIAGKTGTTNDYNDAWFVGYTPKECCVVSVWMGYANGGKQMLSVHGRRVSGGSFPAELFARILKAAVQKHASANAKTDGFVEIKKFPGDLLGGSRRSARADDANGSATKKPRKKRQTPDAPADPTPKKTPDPVQAGEPVTVAPDAVPVVPQDPVAGADPEPPAPPPTVAPTPTPTVSPAPAPEPAPAPSPPEPAAVPVA